MYVNRWKNTENTCPSDEASLNSCRYLTQPSERSQLQCNWSEIPRDQTDVYYWFSFHSHCNLTWSQICSPYMWATQAIILCIINFETEMFLCSNFFYKEKVSVCIVIANNKEKTERTLWLLYFIFFLYERGMLAENTELATLLTNAPWAVVMNRPSHYQRSHCRKKNIPLLFVQLLLWSYWGTNERRAVWPTMSSR